MAPEGDVDLDPGVIVRQSKSELRLLRTGDFSDFTVICGDRQWKAHKAILSKVPYFNATVGGGFQEALQEKITIEEFFEPYEIQWVLAYIYFPHFDPKSARLDTASRSHLETCVRLWQLGDYFQVKGMTEQAERDLGAGCDNWRAISKDVGTKSRGTPFLVDVECGIRRAWCEDLASGPLLREKLTKLCLDFAPYLKHQKSFSALLEEVPQFAIAFSQQALGALTSSLPLPVPTASPKTPRLPKARDDDLIMHELTQEPATNFRATRERSRRSQGMIWINAGYGARGASSSGSSRGTSLG